MVQSYWPAQPLSSYSLLRTLACPLCIEDWHWIVCLDDISDTPPWGTNFSYYIVLNDRIISIQWIGKAIQGSNCGQIWGTILVLACMCWAKLRKTLARIGHIWDEIWSWNFQSMKQECYPPNHEVQCQNGKDHLMRYMLSVWDILTKCIWGQGIFFMLQAHSDISVILHHLWQVLIDDSSELSNKH
jgi:hypothetical protein